MKIIIDILFCAFFSLTAAMNVKNAYVNKFVIINTTALFVVLLCLCLIKYFKKPVLSFAFITVVGIAAAFYDIDYFACYYPVTVFAWTVQCSKELKMQPFYAALSVILYSASSYFCLKNINIGIEDEEKENIYATNKYVVGVIVAGITIIILYVVLKNILLPNDNSSRITIPEILKRYGLMTISYLWSIFFIVCMSLRYKTNISFLVPWMYAMIYCVIYKEPMIYNALSVFKTHSKENEQ